MPMLLETESGLTLFGETGLEISKSVRMIPKNYRNVTGILASKKSLDKACYESSLERDLLISLEFDPNVKAYTVQPITLDWEDQEGLKRTYIPDVFILYKNGNEKPKLIEVKYRSDIKKNWVELKQKFRYAMKFAAQQGWKFKLLTEKEIRTDFNENARFLLGYRYPVPDIDLITTVDDTIQVLKYTTPKQLLENITKDQWEQAQYLTALWYLISTFQIHVDLTRPLTMDSEIWQK
ncbi:TnsA endonuclease N-terminal domain-containing protein [Acinetobacter baumannii]|uniref:TnsA endonuclease N-terminal domain-containing protein n=1 Tax=Acinetobacter baumannii TaxID=470 RepID=UPI001C0CE3E3|nr:TnsA endonuclease N-terminal domain-containing protein [Acinetobacter baumannii]MBU3082502.1 TnsA endonuclease N-terminal domain-containing protein [Acinetobacter baumannii]MDC4652065.1 TnsA endonuclease N-terminal domain-containing protein [Acinetobacter baumannii]MDC5116114.1 TnsA endonuclease N-terminal domain-containing protein [Acinetobacter baumannii]MDC5448917.1 TnsA endonuclease N-terminal domain-containing protein [Acinetobacter baumannii]